MMTNPIIPTPDWNLTPVSEEELLRLKNGCRIPDMPTQMTYHLRRAPTGEGDYAYTWKDKPHRLIYDASREIERLNVRVQQLEDLVEQLNWDLQCWENDS
jgi:hypothetical protein